MSFRIRGVLASVALWLGAVSPAWAAPVPVSIDLTGIRAIQKYTMDEKGDDQVFALISGVAAGKDIQERLPGEGKTWTANPKKLAVSEKEPLTLWKGELNDGEFAVVTVAVFQGAGTDEALLKSFTEQLSAAEQKSPEFAKKTLTVDEFKALSGAVVKKIFQPGDIVKNEQAVIAKIKTLFSRDRKTDHYSGLFNVIVWNDGSTVRKRLAPVGLTFGEHYGIDVKQYTKLKFTRNNVFLQDEKGEWSNDQLSPLSDDEKTVHVKMLETELVKDADGNPAKKTTDYLADVQVKAGSEASTWKLEGEVTGVDDIHRYWEYAD